MNPSDYDFVLPTGPGPDARAPRFSPEAWIRLLDAELAAVIAAGKLQEKLGKFEEVHQGNIPFVLD